MQIPSHVTEHIETIAKLEQVFWAQPKTCSKRSADRTGRASPEAWRSCAFIFFCSSSGSAGNTLARGFHRFDPVSFPLLATIVGLEAILLVSFILMRQAMLGEAR